MTLPFFTTMETIVPLAAAHRRMTPRALRHLVLLAACILPWPAHARAKPQEPAHRLSIAIKSDRLTLAVAKATQVYLAGTIDADAPQQFAALVKAGKIPRGSDVYLDAGGTDIDAGQALGRLLRTGEMVTHLGAAHRPGAAPRAALCTGACAYAYLGGLYRWSPAGSDRFGLRGPEIAAMKADSHSSAATYLKAMDIETTGLEGLPTPPADDFAWIDTDRLLAWGWSNNGRLPLHANYTPSAAPMLTFTQIVRGGSNKLTVSCAADGITLTAYYLVGSERATQLIGRANRAYFEINQQEVMPQLTGLAHTINDAVVFSRELSLQQLGSLLTTYSTGAWIKDRAGAVRYGFTMGPARVRASFPTYYADCRSALQRAGRPLQ